MTKQRCLKLLKKSKKFKFLLREKHQTQRQVKIARLVQEVMTKALVSQKIYNKLLNQDIPSITKIVMSPDLKIADCYFVPFNPESDKEAIKKELELCSWFFKSEIAKNVRMKFIPNLRFFYDDFSDKFF